MRVFSKNFVHSQGWTPRSEALMEGVVQKKTTWHPWLIACDANTCREDFEKSLWFQSRHTFIKEPWEGVSTCRSQGPKGELIERTCDRVFTSRSLQGKIRNMEVVEDFEPRPYRAVSFVVERDKEFQKWREQKCLTALPAFSGGRLPGNS